MTKRAMPAAHLMLPFAASCLANLLDRNLWHDLGEFSLPDRAAQCRRLAQINFTCDVAQLPRLAAKRLRKGRAKALAPNQHAHQKQVEQVGSDAGGKGGRIISELIIEQAGDPAAGTHASGGK